MIDQINKKLENTKFYGNCWIGYPAIKNSKVYFNAKGRDYDIIKNFRDTFGVTSIAGSVKKISSHLHQKYNGFYLIFEEER